MTNETPKHKPRPNYKYKSEYSRFLSERALDIKNERARVSARVLEMYRTELLSVKSSK